MTAEFRANPNLKIDTSSKDYKAGYNLAIQGRIAPAVPAWTDQGKADFAQGYKDGTAAREEEKMFGQPSDEELYGSLGKQMEEAGEFGKPAPEKTATEYISKLCKQSPLSQTEKTKLVNAVEIHDIERAIQVIKECMALDEFDKFELEERLRQKAVGITMPAKEGVPKAPAKPEPRKGIIHAREVTAARKEEEELFEKRREYKNIAELAIGLKPQYNKIVKMGLRDFQEETTKYMPKLNSQQLADLAQKILEAYRRKPATRIVDWFAVGIMDKMGHEILAGGYDWAMSRNERTLDELINHARENNPGLPSDDQIKKDTRTALFALM